MVKRVDNWNVGSFWARGIREIDKWFKKEEVGDNVKSPKVPRPLDVKGTSDDANVIRTLKRGDTFSFSPYDMYLYLYPFPLPPLSSP